MGTRDYGCGRRRAISATTSSLKYYHPEEVKWEKDNNQFIEKTFFEFHYPCFSAVIIDENGKFISYFGEFVESQQYGNLQKN